MISGVLWSEMKESKHAVKKHITACRARKERTDTQKRDLLFKDRSNHRFRVMNSKTVCRKLLDQNQLPTTDPSNIVELFRSYFSKLASSDIDSSSPISHVSDDMDMLDAISFTYDDQILDTDIIVEEFEAAFIALKCGRSKGADGLNSNTLFTEVIRLNFG